jgi:putative membrane protein
VGGDKKGDSDELVLARALARGIGEAKLSERAVKDGQSEEVRRFAQRLVDDHNRANKQLLEIAREMKVAVAQGFDQEAKDTQERFSKLEGAAFDRAFVDHMVKGHEKSIAFYETQARTATNARLKTFANDILPTLRKHLEQARALARKQGNR